MTLFLPYGLNSGLNDRRGAFGKAAADAVNAARNPKNIERLAKIAASGELGPKERAAAVGAAILSGQLRAGSGPNGNVGLAKRASARSFPITSDDPEKHHLNKMVGLKLLTSTGHAGHPAMGLAKTAPGVGMRVRATKAAGDSNLLPLNLPGVQAAPISDAALEVLNSLPDVRMRGSIVSVLLTRPPANPNDQYRWVQSIVALRTQLNELASEMGFDVGALTSALDRRLEFYDFDPMVQTKPAVGSPRGANIGPHPDDDQSSWPRWPSELEPPATPDGQPAYGLPHAFAGADRTDTNPDFARDEKLAKFWDYAKRGIDLRKGESGSREQYEKYGLVVVESEIEGGLKNQILSLHKTRKRASPARWRRIASLPHFGAVLKAIAGHPRLTRAMKGACMALIS